MNYGLQLSASGALTALYRQDVYANNLANINTPGFKADVPANRQRLVVRQEDGLLSMPSNDLLEKLGGGVQVATPVTNFAQGSLDSSANPLDLAIEGNGFFVVRAATSGSADRLRLTRDGRFTLNSEGHLVMATTGMPVLDDQNRPIEITGVGPVTVGTNGVVRQGEREIATLRLVDVPNRRELRKMGENLFAAPATAMNNLAPATGTIVQGARERASVDEITALLDVQSAGRAASANLAMISYQDRMTERAIAQLGRMA
ncbi:MAG: flagellar basal body rod protein FlgG [Phycisphaerae bacterium]|nr:Flagellar basal-body rod protein FlgG [Phycisphaerales bacterium]MCK6478354.1 flagellar hook basal-body protein [Phycisphaerales bacterium]